MDIAVWQAHLLPALAIGPAAFMQGITGFGLVIIAAPLLMIFFMLYFICAYMFYELAVQ